MSDNPKDPFDAPMPPLLPEDEPPRSTSHSGERKWQMCSDCGGEMIASRLEAGHIYRFFVTPAGTDFLNPSYRSGAAAFTCLDCGQIKMYATNPDALRAFFKN